MSFSPGETLIEQIDTHAAVLSPPELSPRVMEVIKSLDSRSFGFLNFQNPSSTTIATNDSTSFVSKEFIQQGIARLTKELQGGLQSNVLCQAEICCQLGHLHLLLEEYSEALSAYHQYQCLSPLESSRNASLHYGLGLIYFSINSFHWAEQSLKEVLRLAPDFARQGEIHLRLGVMFKTKGDYTNSLFHFKQASSLTGPASFSKLEIQFHLGHIYCLQGHYLAAKENFEDILAQKNVPNSIKAMALRQLGWLYQSVPEVAMMTENPSAKTVGLLKLAVGTDPSSSQAWYFLGRCHASQGRVREAFLAYQQAVNKATDNQAEIWCSIGILYHNMGQAKDSLQSYICAVYLDPLSHEAWTDMGCLYESVSQPIDALITYKNAIFIRSAQRINVDKTGQYLFSRVTNLEQYITMVGLHLLQSQPHTLPSVKEAWHSLVPSYLKTTHHHSRTSYTPILDLSSHQISTRPVTSLPRFNQSYGNHSNAPHCPAPKRQRTGRNNDPIVIRNMSDTWHPNAHSVTLPVTTPTGEEHAILAQPNTFTAPDLPPRLLGSLLPGKPGFLEARPTSLEIKKSRCDSIPSTHTAEVSSFHSSPDSIPSSVFTPLSLNSANGLNSFPINLLTSPNTPTSCSTHLMPTTSDLPGDLSSISPFQLDTDVSEEDFLAYLQTSNSQEGLASQTISEFLKSPTEPTISREKTFHWNGLSGVEPGHMPPISDSQTNPECSDNLNVDSLATLQINQEHTSSHTAKSCEAISDSSSGVSSAGTNPLLSPGTNPLHSPYQDEAEELLELIHEPFPSLADDGEYMNHDPDLTPPDPPITKDDVNLRPEVPIFEVLSREEALSEQLHGLCCDPNTPVCMIRGLCPVLEFDLQLFSSKSIVKACPEHEMEVREQVRQAADENFDPNGRKQVWRCESQRTYTTVKEYAKYQKQVLQKQKSNMNNKVESGFSKRIIRFGTNVDLSDWDKWTQQLGELEKLPKFLRVNCQEANLLTHIGYSILGVNSPQLYMKVPGSRTPGHQENHNLCSVNINIGPGGCEWFSVHNKYWGIFHKLCDKHKVCFLTGSWWPILDELEELGVPVYRFTQQPGDIVWLNPGTVHWVQANTVCNNVAWNVGPITAHQFRMAWERYMWNKVCNVRSIVPMIHLSWNLARKIKIVDNALYLQLRSLLESSLAQTHRLTAHLDEAGIPLVPHPQLEGETAPCCNQCLDEVFNILFVLGHKGEYLVYCHKCAMAMKKSFTVLKQFETDHLQHILDNFKLHPRPIYNPASQVTTL